MPGSPGVVGEDEGAEAGPYHVAILPIEGTDGRRFQAVSPTWAPLAAFPKKAAAEAWAEMNGGPPRGRGRKGGETPRAWDPPAGAGLALSASGRRRRGAGGPASWRGRPGGELAVEAGALGGGVVAQGGADGGDGVRARVGEEAGESAHRVQLVDGEVDFPLACEEQVGGAGGRTERGRGHERRATAHAASGKTETGAGAGILGARTLFPSTRETVNNFIF
jgi:hypothetical protein